MPEMENTQSAIRRSKGMQNLHMYTHMCSRSVWNFNIARFALCYTKI
jgi:hypothetical protein